jgi:hypothetical protein
MWRILFLQQIAQRESHKEHREYLFYLVLFLSFVVSYKLDFLIFNLMTDLLFVYGTLMQPGNEFADYLNQQCTYNSGENQRHTL